MSFQIIVTEKEILETPNYFELGKLINNKYWQAKRDLEGPQFDDEHVGLTINEDGLVTAINRLFTCSICNKDTSEVEYDYLVGYNHLTCVLEQENKSKQNDYDTCVVCGKITPYLKSTNINLRYGYIEGAGQACPHPDNCD